MNEVRVLIVDDDSALLEALAVAGDQVHFRYTIVYNDSPLTLTIVAKVSGDTMQGTVDFGGAAQDEYSAKRVVPPGRSP